jgi:hypothetical protein
LLLIVIAAIIASVLQAVFLSFLLQTNKDYWCAIMEELKVVMLFLWLFL